MSNSDLARFSGKKLQDCNFGICANILETDEDKKNMSFGVTVYFNRNINVNVPLFY